MMRLIFKVKGTMQVNDGKMLVQLSGKHGVASLDLPLGHKISVGDEFVLEGDVESLVSIDEVTQRDLINALAKPVSGVPTGPPTSRLTPPPKFKLCQHWM
jgi:hypothetical protein